MPASDFDYEAHLSACAQGDRNALRRLYEREARWLMGVALRIVRRRELADEVLHDAFLQIWQKASSYSPALGSARGWVYSVVRHRALNTAREQKWEHSGTDSLADLEDPISAEPAHALLGDHGPGALHHCLESLDDQKRACILLAYVDGYSQTQIAARLDCPLGTVKAWTRRALLNLKECLS